MCPPDKILNPLTKRCVKKDGVIGRVLAKQSETGNELKRSPRRPSPRSKSPLKTYCYTFNKVKICKTVTLDFFQKQEGLLCGLHAINNLLQNQTRISKPNIVTKQEIDAVCNVNCREDGYYNFFTMLSCIQKYFPDSTYDAVNDLNYIEELVNDNELIGCLYLYKAPKCNNHWVTLLRRGEIFLVVDSEHFDKKIIMPKQKEKVIMHHGNAEVLETYAKVYKYFQDFIGVIIVRYISND